MKLVLDGSAALSILLPDERGSAEAQAILEGLGAADDVLVPGHWWAEVTNGVLMAERRKRVTQAESTVALGEAQALEPETDSGNGERMTRDALGLARLHALTAYDAAYLELAIRHNAGLATMDAVLKRAAVKAGVAVIPS